MKQKNYWNWARKRKMVLLDNNLDYFILSQSLLAFDITLEHSGIRSSKCKQCCWPVKSKFVRILTIEICYNSNLSVSDLNLSSVSKLHLCTRFQKITWNTDSEIVAMAWQMTWLIIHYVIYTLYFTVSLYDSHLLLIDTSS